MNYEIINKNDGIYLPRVDFWIMDDLGLNLTEAMLYSMILVKNYLVWNSEYIGYVLRCSSKTIKRIVDKLTEMEVIEKRILVINGKKRWILVALYTLEGKRGRPDIENYMRLGEVKLRALYHKKG